jgi:hypothetical protein
MSLAELTDWLFDAALFTWALVFLLVALLALWVIASTIQGMIVNDDETL